MERQKKKQKGITLIALVISIIVMLILAGVSLNMTIGENGIVTKAQQAKMLQEDAELEERVKLVLTGAMTRDFDTEEECIEYVNSEFEKQGISEHATFQLDIDEVSKESIGYMAVYGIHSRKIVRFGKSLDTLAEIAAVEGSSEDWTYTLNEETQRATLTGYKPERITNGILAIPNVIDGHYISGLGSQVFMGRTELKEVNFNEGITYIGDKAFSGCSNLESVGSFPSTLKYIGEYAFYDCSKLTTKLVFTDNIETVGTNAFCNCSNMTGELTNLVRPNVQYGQGVFQNCSKITGDVGEALEALEGLTEIPDYMFSGLSKITGTVEIPSTIKRIGNYAFQGCLSVTRIDISNSSSLEEVGKYAFHSCSKMIGELNFKEGLKVIGTDAFRECGITLVFIPKTIEYVGSYAFFRCKQLTSLVLDCGDVFDGLHFFSYCTALQTINFGNNCTMTELGYYMFQSCTSLVSFTMPSTITRVSGSFPLCTNLEVVVFSNNIADLVGGFEGCSKLRTLPLDSNGQLISSLTNIGSAFKGCTELGRVGEDGKTNIIGLLENSNVTTISNDAFNGCIYLEGTYTDRLMNKNSTLISIRFGCVCGYRSNSFCRI